MSDFTKRKVMEHYNIEGNKIEVVHNGVEKIIVPRKRLFNGDVLNKIRPDENLIICEGEFDTMILAQEGYNAIGVPGVTNVPIDHIILIRNQNVYLAFDNDEAGEAAMQKIKNLLNRPISIIKLKQHNDITELINERNKRKDF